MDLAVGRRWAIRHHELPLRPPSKCSGRSPLSELILDFFDKLKSNTKGYASLDYDGRLQAPSQLVKLDILLSANPSTPCRSSLHKDKACDRGRVLCDKLKEIIPRQMFEVPIQAAIGGRCSRARP